MANTLSKTRIEALAKQFQNDMEAEQKLLANMTEAEHIGYLAAKASLSQTS